MSDIPLWPILENYGWDTLPPERDSWRTTRCHAHEDAHGSARVTAEGGGYVWCMACGFKGDSIDVIRHYEPELSFSAALARATDILGRSGHDVPGASGSGRYGPAVSDGSRANARARKYVPPRLGWTRGAGI